MRTLGPSTPLLISKHDCDRARTVFCGIRHWLPGVAEVQRLQRLSRLCCSQKNVLPCRTEVCGVSPLEFATPVSLRYTHSPCDNTDTYAYLSRLSANRFSVPMQLPYVRLSRVHDQSLMGCSLGLVRNSCYRRRFCGGCVSSQRAHQMIEAVTEILTNMRMKT